MSKGLLGPVILILVLSYGSALIPEEELLAKLMDGYDRIVIPDPRPTVKLSVTIKDFDINEQDSTIDLKTWMNFEWKDSRFKWDPLAHFNITSVNIPAPLVWTPDIYVSNGYPVDKISFLQDGLQTNAVIKSNGEIVWIPPREVRASCVLDLTFWPYDKHTCVITLSSWTYSGNDLALGLQYDGEVSIDFDNERGGWILEDSNMKVNTMKFDCCDDLFTQASLTLTGKRRSETYIWNLGLPFSAILFYSMVVFLLPPAANEKVLMASVVFIIDLVSLNCLLKITATPPNRLPIMGQMVCSHLVVISFELLASILVIRMTKKPRSYTPPSWSVYMAQKLGPVLGIGSYVKNVMPNSTEEEKGSSHMQLHFQNKSFLVGAFIDRVLLILTSVILFAFLALFFIVPLVHN